MNEVAKLQVNSKPVTEVNAAAMQELFVINLCASMTPMPAVPKNLEGFEKYKLYQVSRQEDGRRRFRLRLGFFTNEADAEWVLNSVRNLYPAAFTGCITQEDLRFAMEVMPGMRAAPAVVPQANIVAPAKPSPSVKATQAVAAPAAKASAAKPAPKIEPQIEPAVIVTPRATPAPVAAPASASGSVQQVALTLSASTPISHATPATSTPNNAQPFHVGRGVELPETSLELTDEYPALSASTPAAKVEAPQPTTPPAAATGKPSTQSLNKPAASKPNIAASAGPIHSAHLINPPKIVDDYVPILDTTLTIRTLTTTEAEDPNRPKWFAVQLALSEQPVNLEAMPKLDIFAAYSLYSVTVMEGHSIKHALRLGFFRETVSAEAVMGYLKAFFGTPVVTQISSAEYDRFAEKPKVATAQEPAAKVVNLSEKRPVAKVAPPPAAKVAPRPAANSTNKTTATKDKARIAAPSPRPQSFLSRLIGRQLD